MWWEGEAQRRKKAFKESSRRRIKGREPVLPHSWEREAATVATVCV